MPHQCFALLGYGPLQTINMSELYGVVMLHGWCPERTCARDHLCGYTLDKGARSEACNRKKLFVFSQQYIHILLPFSRNIN